MNIAELNAFSEKEWLVQIYKTCASEMFCKKLGVLRPFGSLEEMKKKADELWWSLPETEWLNAFLGHPKIGDMESLAKKYNGSKSWSEGEQEGAIGASQGVLRELKDLNEEYEQRFGFIFIVCATGKSAEEMLSILKKRIDNDPGEEIRKAAAEQIKITHLRMEKL